MSATNVTTSSRLSRSPSLDNVTGAQLGIDNQGSDGAGFVSGDLLLAAQRVENGEAERKACENRLYALIHNLGGPAKREDANDHVEDFTGRFPEVKSLIGELDLRLQVEKLAIRELNRVMEAHPLYDFIESKKGIGAKAVGRFLGLIGDPLWNGAEERPRRGPGELWAYLGMDVRDGQAPKRKRGQKCNWNGQARAILIAHIAEAAYRQGDYREVYLAAREKYEGAVHPCDCPQCGPAGKPAQPGSPLSKGHQHARALRLVAKQFVKDLWDEALRVHVHHEIQAGRGSESDRSGWPVGSQSRDEIQLASAPAEPTRMETVA